MMADTDIDQVCLTGCCACLLTGMLPCCNYESAQVTREQESCAMRLLNSLSHRLKMLRLDNASLRKYV